MWSSLPLKKLSIMVVKAYSIHNYHLIYTLSCQNDISIILCSMQQKMRRTNNKWWLSPGSVYLSHEELQQRSSSVQNKNMTTSQHKQKKFDQINEWSKNQQNAGNGQTSGGRTSKRCHADGTFWPFLPADGTNMAAHRSGGMSPTERPLAPPTLSTKRRD